MKYIIKRVVIAVLSFLAIMLLKQNVFAQVYTTNTGGLSQGVTYWTGHVDMNGGNAFASKGHGTLVFNFSIVKTAGQPSDPPLSARTVYAVNGGASYICDIGSVLNPGNSTYTEEVYSASCPFDADNSGLVRIRVNFTAHNPQTTTSQFQLVIAGLVTFVTDNSVFLPSINQNVGSIQSHVFSIDSSLSTFRSNFIDNIREVKQNQSNTTTAINNSSTATTNAISNQTQAIEDASDRVNDTLTNDNVSEASTTGGGFFNNFQENSHGLSGIITAPLRLINSFTTQTCQPLEFDLPFVHNHVFLSCMKPIYQTHFGVFFAFYQMLTSGVLCYMVLINILAKVKQLQNPFNDRIAVLNL